MTMLDHPAAEAEFEFERAAEALSDGESGGVAGALRGAYPDASLLADLASRAATTERDEDAAAFLGALVPLTLPLAPRAAPAFRDAAPLLIRGIAAIGRQLRQQSATRELVEALPVITQRTLCSLADQSTAGHPLRAGAVAGTLSRVAEGVLGDRVARRRAVRAVRAFGGVPLRREPPAVGPSAGKPAGPPRHDGPCRGC